MSASPSGTLPNGRHAPVKGAIAPRRRPKADPLVARKKPKPRARTLAAPSSNETNGPTGPASLNLSAIQDAEQKLVEFDRLRQQNGGWTHPRPPLETGVREFPLVLTKRSLREDRRFHVMRLQKAAKGTGVPQDIDPTDQEDFTRPVSLHRRDPRQPPPGRAVKEEAATPPSADDKEAERIAQQKADKEAQRAADMAQIAPTIKNAVEKRPSQKKEKTVQYYPARNNDEKRRKEGDIHYEEALPWHLEDADGKNVWVGSYVSALSEANVALVIDGSNLRMVPLEKYYKFTSKPPFKSFTVDEAEALMTKQVPMARWAMRDNEKKEAVAQYEASRSFLSGPTRVKLESSSFRNAPRSEKLDHDDIDMEGDEFQDDDEQVGLDEPEVDEEAKDSKERVRRDQLGANLFGTADELEVEKEQADLMMAELKRKLDSKGLRRIARRDGTNFQQPDTEEDYSEDSSSSDSDEKDEADGVKKEDDAGKSEAKDKTASGAASKGTTTPSGKTQPGDASKKSKSLKRPGSPNLSESSGNESTRKRVKKQTTGSTSAIGGRSTTPMPGRPKANAQGGGALSDGEATAGEMSDGNRTKKQKIKLVGTGSKGTPAGSRAGSPGLAPGSSNAMRTTPRAGSPSQMEPVEAWEIEAVLREHPEGIQVGVLLRSFSTRVGTIPGQMDRKVWIKLVKDTAEFGKDKLLRLKPKTA